MKLTAIIYPDSETDRLVAECPEIADLYLESFPHADRKPAVIHTFELAHG
jgi:hypothetical protein